MDASARNELNGIIWELNSIISELDSISRGVRKEFVGIGSDKCASCIDRVVSQYRYVVRTLNSMDTNAVVEGFAGGGGR